MQSNYMDIILVSDIFGITPSLLALQGTLKNCDIIDPYEGKIIDFRKQYIKNIDKENHAYSTFVNTVGYDKYFLMLTEKIKTIRRPTILVGFSIEASVIWRLSATTQNQQIKQGICYYGSQIRNFEKIKPRFNINLIFPASEPHFDVVALQNKLATTLNVKTTPTKYLHGFMNSYSKNYNKEGYLEHKYFLETTLQCS